MRRILPAIFAYRRYFILLALVIGLVVAVDALSPQARRAILDALLHQRDLLLLLGLFVVIALSLLWAAGDQLDAKAFLLFHRPQIRSKFTDRLMFLLTQFGNGLTGFLLAAAFYYLGYRLIATEILLGTFTLWIAVEMIKALTDRTRPYHIYEATQVVGWKEIGRSFPSGHTSQSFFLASILLYHYKPGAAISLAVYILAALVGLTRIYVGAHYPRDVIAGALLGSIWGLIAALIDPLLGRRFF